MPRPILSETTFNSDNIATSILQQANLQIANSSLGVTDVSNKFDVYDSSVNEDTSAKKCYEFMGFIFINLRPVVANASGNVYLYQINDSDYYPDVYYYGNTISYQKDSVNAIVIYPTNGIISGDSVDVPSGSDANFRFNINMWYRKVG